MKFEILTIFPDFFRGPLHHGIVRRAREAEIIDVRVQDLRMFTHDKHRTVDDRPFGGGEGMVLKPEPIFECAESLAVSPREARVKGHATESVILLSPQGRLFTQSVAEELSKLDRLVLICGRYEGVDERVSEHLADRELSIGSYVLSGGELAAAIIVDVVARLLPGALGNENSARQESFASGEPLRRKLGMQSANATPHDPIAKAGQLVAQRNEGPDSTCASGGLLDYPHYTRPAEFRGMKVPDELVSGHHDQIRIWRRQKGLEKTLRNRPELLKDAELSDADKRFLAGINKS